MLLGELIKKFPIPQIVPAPTTMVKKEDSDYSGGDDKSNGAADLDNIKQEKMDMRPPEKKMKFN